MPEWLGYKVDDLVGRTVDLYFGDGYAVRAVVLEVKPSDIFEIMYEVVDILDRGPTTTFQQKAGEIALEDTRDIVRIVPLPGPVPVRELQNTHWIYGWTIGEIWRAAMETLRKVSWRRRG